MDDNNEISLRELYVLLKKRRFTIFTLFVVMSSIITLGIFTYGQELSWRASSKLLIEDGGEKVDLTKREGFVSWDPTFLQTQFQIIRSRPVISKVVERLRLDTTYSGWFITEEKEGLFHPFIEPLVSFVRSFIAVPLESRESQFDELKRAKQTRTEIITDKLTESIQVKISKNSRIVEVSYDFKNPVIASLIVNAISKAYIDELMDMHIKSSDYAVRWMTGKSEEQRRQLEESEKKLHDYMRKKNIVSIENNVDSSPRKVNGLINELTIEETRAKDLKSLINTLDELPLEELLIVPKVSEDKSIQRIRIEVSKTKQVLLDYSKKYGRKHPAMIRVVNDLEMLEENLYEEASRIIQTVQADHRLSEKKINTLKAQIKLAKNEALTLNEKYVQYKILKRDVETYRHLYNALVSKMKEQTLSTDIQPVSVWTVEEAVPPVQPLGRNRVSKTLVGLFFSLFSSVFFSLFIEYIDNTVKSVEETESRFNLPVLSVISRMDTKEGRIEDVVRDSPLSSISEGYKSLRASIMLTGRDKPPRCILFTSMAPSDGKTTTTINLATALANSGKKVVLIGADLRKPTLARIMGLSNDVGLSTYLSGNTDEDIVIKTDVENLWAIMAGPIPPLPSELLSSERLKELIARLHETYDMVVIDSPPVMPVSDSLILSRLVDTTVIVVRAGKTSNDMLARGIKALANVGTDVKGLVINGASKKNGGYYYYGSGYYGGYTYGGEESTS